MRNWYLRDDGIPIEIATMISGLPSRGAFTYLRADGAFGPAGPDPVDRASLSEVAAARALVMAEMVGVVRERARPVLTQIADSALVQLAKMELGRRSWDPRRISSGFMLELAEKVHSDDGLLELQKRLGVRSRTSSRFVIFTPDQPVFADSPPEPGPDGATDPYIDIWKISQHLRNKVDGVLFHGVFEEARVA